MSNNVDEKLNEKQNTTVSVNNQPEVMNAFDEYRKKNERHQYLLQLQNKFENKMIFERDISESDKADLEALYMEQISNLKRKIRTVESKIQKIS